MSIAQIIASLIATGFLLFMGGCQEDPQSELMPLKVGNYWIYELSHYIDGQIVQGVMGSGKVEIIEEIAIDYEGQSYRVTPWNWFIETGMTPTGYKYLFWQGDDGLYSLGAISATDTLLHKFLYLKYAVQKGDSFEVPRIIYNARYQTLHMGESVTFTCVATNEKYKTPAGTFRCYVFHSRRETVDDVATLSDFYEYYAPGIGLVGQEIEVETARDVQYDIRRVLHDYNVN